MTAVIATANDGAGLWLNDSIAQ